jgi:hypothetical protein
MKRKPRGRPKKSAKGQHRWWARAAAGELRYALKMMRAGKDACWGQFGQFGRTVCVSCDPDNPAKFLREVADELDGKPKHSPNDIDYKIYAAWWAAFIEVFASAYPDRDPLRSPLSEVLRAAAVGPHPTYAQWKVKFKTLWGNAKLPRDSVLQRSINRLGLPRQK